MLPFEIPKGTTLEALVNHVVPEAHAKLVPTSAGREPYTCALEIAGRGRWVVRLDGASMKVAAGEERAPDIRISVAGEDAQAFLDDYVGPQRLVPKTRRPAGGVQMLSDPRVLKRVKMVTGVIELAITDFVADPTSGHEARRVALSIALGAPAKKVEPDPDVVIEVTMRTYLRLLGTTPEEALADGDVSVKGKRLLAMQVAFAIGPLFAPTSR
jgi:hypothetical protein